MSFQRGFFREVTLRKSLQRSLFTETLFFPIYSNLQNYHCQAILYTYHKVTSSSLSRLAAHLQIFRRAMKGKFDFYVRSFRGGHFRQVFQGRSLQRFFQGDYFRSLFRQVTLRKSLQRGLLENVISERFFQGGHFKEVNQRSLFRETLFFPIYSKGQWTKRPMGIFGCRSFNF